jgi:hypothetical protein
MAAYRCGEIVHGRNHIAHHSIMAEYNHLKIDITINKIAPNNYMLV